jgi:hypothetical protein
VFVLIDVFLGPDDSAPRHLISDEGAEQYEIAADMDVAQITDRVDDGLLRVIGLTDLLNLWCAKHNH